MTPVAALALNNAAVAISVQCWQWLYSGSTPSDLAVKSRSLKYRKAVSFACASELAKPASLKNS